MNIWVKPLSLEERLIWYYLLLIYPIYFIGGQFLFAPLLGWVLATIVIYRWVNNSISFSKIHPATFSWLIGSFILAIAYIVGMLDFNFSLFKIITTLIFEWGKGYGLIPLFIVAGNILYIRKSLLVRAVCLLALQSIFWLPIFTFARLSKFEGFTSPLQKIGRGGDIFYGILRSASTLEGSEFRLSMFAPWAPALGFIFLLLFFICREEKINWIKWGGMIASVIMVCVSVSRLGIVALPTIVILVWWVGRIRKPLYQYGVILGIGLSGVIGPSLYTWLDDTKQKFDAYRSSSSIVRERLGEIGLRLWWKEAVVWGHGLQTKGPAIVRNMPIGSHHTWIALLYVNGLVGFLSVLIPYIYTLGVFIIKFRPTGLAIVLGLGLYSFGETWDSVGYLIWPALVYLGLEFKGVTNVCNRTV